MIIIITIIIIIVLIIIKLITIVIKMSNYQCKKINKISINYKKCLTIKADDD